MAEPKVYEDFTPKKFGQVAFTVGRLNPEIQKVLSRENLPAPAKAAIRSSMLKPKKRLLAQKENFAIKRAGYR